jgi:hypothetical protein
MDFLLHDERRGTAFMPAHSPSWGRFGFLILVVACILPAAADEDPKFAPFPKERFSALAIDAIETYFDAEAAYKASDYATADRILTDFWKKYPPGTTVWARDGSARVLKETTGANFGSPPCYYALRMLTDCVRWRVSTEKEPKTAGKVSNPHAIIWTVVLIGRSAGIEPTTEAELEAGTGVAVEHELDPELLADNFRVIRESQWLFTEYVSAITSGAMVVRPEFVHLATHTVPVKASGGRVKHAQPPGEGIAAVFREVPPAVRRATDWWFVIHPSHVPSRHADFATAEFVTGGMGAGPDGGSPCFLSNDLWVTRKPPHLGRGIYTDHERRAYLPQWYQHEFFHYLFRTYRGMKLEEKSHQWFDRKTWPSDFEGLMEPDYYHEALHKRLLTADAQPPLTVALRYAAAPADVLRKITKEAVVGEYHRVPVENNFHRGTISATPDDSGRPKLSWKNAAGVSWSLVPELATGSLATGPDNPYFKKGQAARSFVLILERDADGNYLPRVRGFRFNNEEYVRQGK